MTYMTFAYLLGLVFFLLPEIYQKHIRGQSEYEMMLSKSLGNGYNIICSNQTNEQSALRRATISFVCTGLASGSLLYIGVFKILQGKMKATYLWLDLKVNNTYASAITTGALIMFQYSLSTVMLFQIIIMRFVSCTVPLTEAYDFSWKDYGIRLVRTIVWLVITISIVVFLLLGTFIDQAGGQQEKLQEGVLEAIQTAVLDYECAGSRVWPLLTLYIIPNALILVKVLTN